jgi:hypothetical protein
MSPTSPQASGDVILTLAWIVPLSGIVLWVCILPSTRALARRRFTRTAPEPITETAVEAAEPVPTPGTKRREDDAEIRGFDREIVRAKFAKDRPTT